MIRGKTKGLAIATSILSIAVTPAWADELSDVCGNLSTAGTLKTQYCQAAQAASKAADTDGALWKVYAAVSAVCTTACVSSFAGGELAGTGIACQGTSLAASATDAVMTKNYTSALMGIATSGYGLYSAISGAPSLPQLVMSGVGGNGANAAAGAANTGSGSLVSQGSVPDSMGNYSDQISRAGQEQGGSLTGGTDQASAPTKNDMSACLSAAVSAYQSYSKYSAQQQEEQTENQNLASAEAVTNTTADAVPSTATTSPGGATTGGANTGAGTTETAAANQNTTSSAGTASCSSSAASTIQCAIASDSGLSNTATPAFSNALQRSSGMPFGQFIAGAQSPNQAIGSGLGGSMTPTGTAAVENALDSMEKSMDPNDTNGAAMMALGRAGGGGAVADNTDPSALMSGLLDKLMPKKGDKQTSINDEDFTKKARALASANPEENRNLSIFDRIAYRYVVLTPSLIGSNSAAKAVTRTN
jgi:hypothetical protein